MHGTIMYTNLSSNYFHRKCFGFFGLNIIRTITSAQIATALRPFYFVVHPDLFGRHPDERSINEESLKHLSAHFEALQNRRILSSLPRTLNFYLRDSEIKDKFKLVRIQIDRTYNVKEILNKILETCSLPTDYLNKMKSEPVTKSKSSDGFTSGGQTFHGASPFSDEFEIYQRIKKARQEKTLKSWIQANLNVARERSNQLAELREEVDRLEKSIASRLKLKSMQYDCGWNIEHYRGCLKSLERMANMHEKDMKPLEGRTLVFAPISGVSLEGHIMLFTGDVQRNWLDFIKNISKQDDYLKLIPSYESALSQVLCQIRIARRKFMPKAQVVNYASQLTKVTTSMLDYLTFHKYPKSWPNSLKDFEIVIESEAGPLMVSPTGQFIAPSTCPGSILVDFLTTHMDEATQKMEEYKTNKYIERELHQQCIIDLQLKALTKDDSIDPNKMIESLKNLIKAQLEFKDINLHITHYYSVLADGTVCIPWDWTLE